MNVNKAIIGVTDGNTVRYTLVFTVLMEDKDPVYLHFPLEAPSVEDLKLFLESCIDLFQKQDMISIMDLQFKEVNRERNFLFGTTEESEQ